MDRKILITGGPTNESIDKNTKITNVSTGRLALNLAKYFRFFGYDVTLILTKGISYGDTAALGVKVIQIETTSDLLDTLKNLPDKNSYSVVIHSSAVADYKPEFTYRAEDMAQEIIDRLFDEHKYLDETSVSDMVKTILNTLTNPDCKVCNVNKIPSHEPNLCVKMGLTPQIISYLRDLFPHALICGFKSLEDADKSQTIDMSQKLCIENKIDIVFASILRYGEVTRLIVDKNGFTGKEGNDYIDMADYIMTLLTN